jgi:hypothetical protein
VHLTDISVHVRAADVAQIVKEDYDQLPPAWPAFVNLVPSAGDGYRMPVKGMDSKQD